MSEIATNKQLSELLESFDTAMLLTRHGDTNHARPMAIAERLMSIRKGTSRRVMYTTSPKSVFDWAGSSR